MIEIALVITFFTNIILYLIIFDIILSWLMLFWLKWRPAFLSSIVEPIYSFIGKYIPTSFWMFRFDALIAIIIIYFIQWLLVINVEWLKEEILRLTSYL